MCAFVRGYVQSLKSLSLTCLIMPAKHICMHACTHTSNMQHARTYQKDNKKKGNKSCALVALSYDNSQGFSENFISQYSTMWWNARHTHLHTTPHHTHTCTPHSYTNTHHQSCTHRHQVGNRGQGGEGRKGNAHLAGTAAPAARL